MNGPSLGGVNLQGQSLSTGSGTQPTDVTASVAPPAYSLDWGSTPKDVGAINPEMYGTDMFKVLGGYGAPVAGTTYQDYLNELQYQSTNAVNNWNNYNQQVDSAPTSGMAALTYGGPTRNPFTNQITGGSFQGAANQAQVENPYTTYGGYYGKTPEEIAKMAKDDYLYSQQGGIGLPGGLGDMLGPLAMVASFIPGLQPLAFGLNAMGAMQAASNDNFSGAFMSAAGMMPGLQSGLTGELAGHIPTDLPLDSMTIAKGLVGGAKGALGAISKGDPLEGAFYGGAGPLISGGLQQYGNVTQDNADATAGGVLQGINYLTNDPKTAARNSLAMANPYQKRRYVGPSPIGINSPGIGLR